MNRNTKGILAKAALLTATVIWGSSFFIMKNTLDTVPPFYMIAIRFSVAAVVLSLFFIKKFRHFNLKHLIGGGVMGAILFTAYCLQTFGLMSTTPGKNAFLTTVYCMIVPFLCWAFLRVRPDIYNILASVICIVGIALVSLNESLAINLGDILTLISGFFYAAHIVAVTRFSKDNDIFLLTIVQFAVSGVLGFVMALLFDPFPTHIGLDAGISLLYLCLFSTTAALLLQNVGQKYTHPSTAAILLSLESVFGVLFSILFYGEVLTPKVTIGFLLIFAAVLLSETKLQFLRKKQ